MQKHPPLRLPSSFCFSEVWMSQRDCGHGSLRPGVQAPLHSPSLWDLLAEPRFLTRTIKGWLPPLSGELVCLASVCGGMGTGICFSPFTHDCE